MSEEERIAVLSQRIENQVTILNQQLIEMSDLQRARLNLEKEKSKLESDLFQEKKKVAELERHLEFERDSKDELRKDLENCKNNAIAEKEQLEHEQCELRQAMEQYRQWVQSMQNSTSWKVTAPIRKLLDIFRGIK